MPGRRKLLVGSALCVGALGSAFVVQRQWDRLNRVTWGDEKPPNYEIASRETLISRQRGSSTPYDVLVIGGGATGVGVALDAATRGLRVSLVEADDFSSGTFSRTSAFSPHITLRHKQSQYEASSWWRALP
jgi:hypothetical protein